MIELLGSKTQYKANLHSHSVLSDGHLTPEQMKNAYKQRGYSILSITDHEYPKAHNDMTESDFLMLTGYEAYIRPDSNCKFNRFTPEMHLNLFARDPENETIINYNPCCCRYTPATVQAEMKKAGSQRTREYSLAYLQEFIDTAVANGYLVSLNHPFWDLESFQTFLLLHNCFSMEICNYASHIISQREYCGQLYDMMLRQGEHIFCHATDDNHNAAPFDDAENDSFGGFTMVLADQLTYPAVFSALEKGEFYASTGPTISRVWVEGKTAHITCSPSASIIMHYGSKNPAFCLARPGETVTQAQFPIHQDAQYLQFCVTDEHGNHADTRGYFAGEFREG